MILLQHDQARMEALKKHLITKFDKKEFGNLKNCCLGIEMASSIMEFSSPNKNVLDLLDALLSSVSWRNYHANILTKEFNGAAFQSIVGNLGMDDIHSPT